MTLIRPLDESPHQTRRGTTTCNDVNAFLTAAGYEWATAHTFRHTVATVPDLAGLSAREIADYLGHKHASMTHEPTDRERTSCRLAVTRR